jgi:hypothetical protein
MTRSRATGLASYFSLFSSVSTLACCALPSLLVLVGLGATVASLLSAAPWLVVLSRHKVWVFLFSGLLIAANFLYLYRIVPRLRSRAEPCPSHGPQTCDLAARASRVVLWISAGIYLTGLFVSYLLGPILMRFDS